MAHSGMEYQEFGFIDSMPPNWLPSLSLLWQQFQSFLCNLTSRKVDLCDTQPSETYWEPSRMFLSSILYFIVHCSTYSMGEISNIELYKMRIYTTIVLLCDICKCDRCVSTFYIFHNLEVIINTSF